MEWSTLQTVLALTAAVMALRVAGSVDEFQCACAYNAQKHVKRLRTLLGAGVDDREVAKVAAAYGALASRMLLVAHGRPGAAPTAGWLWLLNLFANTVLDRATTPQQRPTENGQMHYNRGSPVADGVDRVDDGLSEYASVCSGRGVARDTAEWTQQMFEKYVLENMTAIVADDGRSEDDYRPRWLYLNDVADDLGGVLAPNVGVDWGTAASQLQHVHGLAARRWMFGTAELVLFQKKFMSVVAASAIGHALVHVNHCRAYWAANVQSQAKDDDGSAVDEYSRVWMSVGGLLESFRSYLDLRRGSDELHFDAMLDIAANPALDDDGFGRARRTIEASIADVGDGLFGVGPPAADDANAIAEVVATAGDSEENPILGLIALVDNNISTAEKYLKTVQGLLQNVDFKIVHDFMKSTHIWLT